VTSTKEMTKPLSIYSAKTQSGSCMDLLFTPSLTFV
jgi:hypothetical protein